MLRRLLRRVFLEDWSTKLIALGITLALWFGVVGLSKPMTSNLRAKLILRTPNDMELTSTPVQEVEIVVTGYKEKIDALRSKEISRDLIVALDLTDIKPGERVVQLSPETINIDLPSGVKLDEIQPSKIPLTLEKVEQREVEIRIETEGNPAEGFEVYYKTALPGKVRVRGPQSFVRALDSISTEKIEIEGKNADFSVQQATLNLVNPKITLIDSLVDINVRIGEKRVERAFSVQAKSDTGVKEASVVLFGPRSVLEKLRPDDIKLEMVKGDGPFPTPRMTLPTEIQSLIELRKVTP